jgi:hypothetical protein
MEKKDRSEYFKEYRKKNRERMNANLYKWQRENKEKVRGYVKKYRNKPETKEKMNARRREYYQENIEVMREKNRIRQANYRARKKAEMGV